MVSNNVGSVRFTDHTERIPYSADPETSSPYKSNIYKKTHFLGNKDCVIIGNQFNDNKESRSQSYKTTQTTGVLLPDILSQEIFREIQTNNRLKEAEYIHSRPSLRDAHTKLSPEDSQGRRLGIHIGSEGRVLSCTDPHKESTSPQICIKSEGDLPVSSPTIRPEHGSLYLYQTGKDSSIIPTSSRYSSDTLPGRLVVCEQRQRSSDTSEIPSTLLIRSTRSDNKPRQVNVNTLPRHSVLRDACTSPFRDGIFTPSKDRGNVTIDQKVQEQESSYLQGECFSNRTSKLDINHGSVRKAQNKTYPDVSIALWTAQSILSKKEDRPETVTQSVATLGGSNIPNPGQIVSPVHTTGDDIHGRFRERLGCTSGSQLCTRPLVRFATTNAYKCFGDASSPIRTPKSSNQLTTTVSSDR